MTGSQEIERGPLALPPPLLYATALLLGVAANRWRPLAASRRHRTLVPGMALIGAATVTVGLVVGQFRRAKTPFDPRRAASALVTGGPFRYSRHPAYVALTAVHLGVGLLLNNAWVILLTVLPVAVMDRWMIPREERHLAERFGDEYARYRARVRRWL